MTATPDRVPDGLGFNAACLPDRTLDEALEAGYALGLRCVELLAFEGYHHTAGELAGLFFDRMSEEQRRALSEKIARFNRVSVHAPFWDVVPFASNPTTRDASREQLRRTVEVAGAIGAETVTTHVIPRVGRSMSDFGADVVDFYRELGEVATEAGVTVTIETGYPAEIEQFASLIHGIEHPAVGANVDVGHLRGLLTEDERAPDALPEAYNGLLRRHVESLAGRIYHVHLHDVQAEGVRDHRECGTGVIDYEGFFTLLREQEYAGMVMFELEEADAVESLRRSRDVAARAMYI